MGFCYLLGLIKQQGKQTHNKNNQIRRYREVVGKISIGN